MAITTVPTFHCISVEWSPVGGGSSVPARAHFRKQGSGAPYRKSYDFVWVSADSEYRGSLVDLLPDTNYDIRLELDTTDVDSTTETTWSEVFPEGGTTIVAPPEPQTVQYLIDAVTGTANAWEVYTGTTVLDGDESISRNLEIRDSEFIIIRGMTFKAGEDNAIWLSGTTNNVLIEDCIFEDWGSPPDGGPGQAGNNTPAIGTVDSNGANIERIIIQRCLFRNPRYDTNSWAEAGHPFGPSAIHFRDTKGNHVIRYNKIHSTNGNYYNDAIGGGSNFGIGSLNRDSDVYQNEISQVWDDCIEVEGRNRNIRIWGNFMTETFVGVAVAQTSQGPAYIWRNIVYRTTREEGDYTQGTLLKTANGGGQIFSFHNTSYHNGTATANIGIGGTNNSNFITSRNNIIDTTSRAFWVSVSSASIDMDYDLYDGTFHNVTPATQEVNGTNASAVFDGDIANQGYALAAGATGLGLATPLANFNDLIVSPDVGAQQRGGELLQFGLNAAPALKSQDQVTRLGLYGGSRGPIIFPLKPGSKAQALLTRLGLYGGTRGLYGDFSGKVGAGKIQPLITRLGLYGGTRGLYGDFSNKDELIIIPPSAPAPPEGGGGGFTRLITDREELLTRRLEIEDEELLKLVMFMIENGILR